MASWLTNFTQLLSNNIWLALLGALVGGLISSFSPCVLSSLPLVLGYVGGYAGKDKKLAFKYSLIFSTGLIVTLTAVGAASALLGKLLTGIGTWWYLLLALVMFLVGLQLIGVINYGNNICKVPNKRKGLIGAFFLGILGGVFCSPCSTPVLVAILAFVAGSGNLVLGVLMLLLYSIGHCALIILAGTSVGLVEALSSSERTMKIGNILKLVLALLVFAAGLYLVYLAV